MKIALVNSEYPSPSGSDHGGIATYTYTLASLMAQRGHTVHILTRSGIRDHDMTPLVHIHQFGFRRSTNCLTRLIGRFGNNPLAWEQGQSRALSSLLAAVALKDGLDIVEFPEYGGLACCYRPVKRIPCCITFHTPSELVDTFNGIQPAGRHRQQYLMERRAIRRAAAFKSPSTALKNWVCEHYGLPPASVTTIHNPFDASSIRKIRRPADDLHRFDILFSGRFERRKGAELLLHCIKKILSINNVITFTIAGETDIGNSPNYRQSIERILSPEERMRVWFPGPLSFKKLLPLYSNSSLFLFPSLFENSPYALLEAMSAGLPVVATACSGINEIITHNENGLLFSPDDHETLIGHIRALFDNRDLASSLGRNALATIQQLYDPEKIINSHCAFYQSVLTGRR
ncbi:MAG: glycosyltransferase family 4 protein [Chitinispirillaceae bacterium]|nr:glycosyltransferase family 4 protein [Chitinispirillaceae bacterium]